MIQPIGFLGRREATKAPTVEKDAAMAAALKAAPNSRNESPADTPRKVITKAVAPKRAENTQIDQASLVAGRVLMSPASSRLLCASACANLTVAIRGLMGSPAILINRAVVYGSLERVDPPRRNSARG